MNMIWNLLTHYFSPKEKWGNPDKMKPELLFCLWKLRRHLERSALLDDPRIIINCGYEERKTGGGHPDGRAVDFHVSGLNFLKAEALILDFMEELNLENWIALGIYPEWGDWKRPGFHLEIEKEKREKPRRWGAYYERNDEGRCLLGENGQVTQKYIAYDLARDNYFQYMRA